MDICSNIRKEKEGRVRPDERGEKSEKNCEMRMRKVGGNIKLKKVLFVLFFF